MECPKCGNPAGTGEPGAKAGLYHQGVRVMEGSLLFKVFSKLARLPETEIAKVASFMDLFYAGEGTGDALARMQRQIERLEQRLGGAAVHAEAALPAEEEGAIKKRGPRKRGPKKMEVDLAEAVSLPSETVEERHARMARMEKEERMKAQALKKRKETISAKTPSVEAEAPADREAPAEGGTSVHDEEKAPPKKRPRRRRRRPKGGAGIPSDAAMPA